LPVAQLQHHALPWPADGGVRSMPRMCTVLTVLDPVLGAVRVMTTHLEFYSKRQRMAQARALLSLHEEACARAAAPPELSADGSPFQSKPHTALAVLCGDFNFQVSDPEYGVLTAPAAPARLWDAWKLLNGDAPHPPTFQLYDRRYGPEPVGCDFFFVSEGLRNRLRALSIDSATQASDHQPLALELA
jgi:endonuclease/exonuclease/phosphatase family metal-dependent hydrolase